MAQVFVVIALSHASAVGAKIDQEIPDTNRHQLASDKWLVTFDGISKDLAEKLGIRSDPAVGTGLVFPIQGYSGRAGADVWEWLSLKST